MKKLLLFLATCLSLVTTSFVSAKDVDYNIRLYWGRLTPVSYTHLTLPTIA